MKLTRQIKVSLVMTALLLPLCIVAEAGVSVRNGRDGRNGGKRVSPRLTLAHNQSPWGVVPSDLGAVWTLGRWHRSLDTTLNPDGAHRGDLWPTIVSHNVTPHYPWVVWSRFNGQDYDLVWSRWLGDGWQAIDNVEMDPSGTDELDADLAFDPAGRPYLVWWRSERKGQVYLSAYRQGQWTRPFRVSLTGRDSRYPIVALLDVDRIQVEYRVPRGLESRLVVFPDPVTITDDINPQFAIEGPASIRPD